MESSINNLCPETDPILQSAWASALSHQLKDKGARKAFEKEVGLVWLEPENPTYSSAAGLPTAEEYVEKFVEWFNKRIW